MTYEQPKAHVSHVETFPLLNNMSHDSPEKDQQQQINPQIVDGLTFLLVS